MDGGCSSTGVVAPVVCMAWAGAGAMVDPPREGGAVRPSPLPDSLPLHGFSVAKALDAGVHPERLRRRDLAAPFRGVRTHQMPGNVWEAARAYAEKLPDRGFFSHTTAAQLWGLPLPGWARQDARLHVSYPHGDRAVRAEGIVGHHLVVAPLELTLLDGLPVTTPVRTWCDLGTILPLEDLIAAGDRLLWFREPFATADELHEMARRYPGRRGARTRRLALRLLSERSFSPPESVLRTRIILAGLPTPLVNPELFDRHGAFIAMPDLLFERFDEVVEYEGDHHRSDREQWHRDLARVPRLEAAGYHTTRAAAPDLLDGSRRLLGILAASLRAKGWTGPSQPPASPAHP